MNARNVSVAGGDCNVRTLEVRAVTERAGRLRGVGVLVTRPESAAVRLANALAAEGAIAHRVPAIEIVPVVERDAFERVRKRMREASAAVFTSVNAVEGFCNLIQESARDALPPVVLAVGEASVGALCARRVAGVGTPSGRFDSEGLLACPQLESHRVRGRLVAIVKGEGGRDLLARALRGRGAEVVEVNVYRRRAPEQLSVMLDDVRESVDVVTVTSAEALGNLIEAAPWTGPWLSKRPLVTVSERVAGVARDRHLPRVTVASGADVSSVVEATVLAMAGSLGGDARLGAELGRHEQDGGG